MYLNKVCSIRLSSFLSPGSDAALRKGAFAIFSCPSSNHSASFPHRVWWLFLFSWLLVHLQKAFHLQVGQCTDAMTTRRVAYCKIFSLRKISHELVKDVYRYSSDQVVCKTDTSEEIGTTKPYCELFSDVLLPGTLLRDTQDSLTGRFLAS